MPAQMWSSDRSPSAAAILSASAVLTPVGFVTSVLTPVGFVTSVLTPVGFVTSGIADDSPDDDAPLALRARASAP